MLIRPRRIQHISCWFKFLPQLILMIVVDWKINISFSGAGIFLLLLLLLNMHLIDSYNNYASEKVINLANVVTDATYFPWSFRCGAIYIYIYIYIYVRYTVLFCDGVRRLGIGNTEESNNKSTESIRTETDSKAMRKRSKYSKAQVNETWAYKNQSDDGTSI